MTRYVIITPTRNRPDALRMTLSGLSAQRHEDVTFVVSDNSDDEVAPTNRAIVGETLGGRRHLVIRPERVLPMVSHWNFALAHAPWGEFTGFVTDRMTLVPDALALCDEVLAATGEQAVSFNSKEVSLVNGVDLPSWPKRVVARGVRSTEVLADFSRSRLRKDSPRFLNSVASRAVLDRIEARFGAVFGGIAPDYAFAFRFLDVAPGHHHLEAPLLIDHSPQISNGMAVTRNIGNKANQDFVKRLLAEQAAEFSVGPIPNETRLLNNVILREMEIARGLAQGPTKFPEVDAAAFYGACATSLRRSLRILDPDSRALKAQIDAYRQSHGLRRWSASVRRGNFAIALRNSLSRLLGSGGLPGVARTPAQDLDLLARLQALPRSSIDYIPELQPA